MDLFDLVAKITLDSSGYDESVEDADKKGKGLAGTIGSGLASAAKIGTAAMTAAAGGIAALTGASIKGYAEQEQLIGGIETMFEDLVWDIQDSANEAYKTAGLSANEYMDTVMGFSAALTSSLKASEGNIVRAADLSDQIVIDMADNANKMGSSMESIQNAYSGFAKQNYTMLDNLKLGYGGTKSEMERLLKDAEKLTGKKFDIDNFADVAEAIHAVQEEMGIAGTTAKEASETISGSVAAAKSAWSNLVTGISDDNADFEALVGNFVDSIAIAAGNIAPRLEVALSGIGILGEKIAPLIADGITTAVEKAPEFLKTAASMLGTLGGALLDQSDLLMQDALDLVLVILDGLIAGADNMGKGALQLIESLAIWIEEYSDVIFDKAATLIDQLVDGVIDNLPDLIVAAVHIIGSLATGLIEHLPDLVMKIPEIVKGIVDAFAEAMPDIIEVGKDIVKGLWEGIKNLKGWIGEKVTGFLHGLFNRVKEEEEIHSPSKKWARIGGFMAEGIGVGWDEKFSSVSREITDGMDFGVSSVDFGSSGIGRHSQNTLNGIFAAQDGAADREYTINVVMDKDTVASLIFDPLRGIVEQRGVGLA